MAEIIIPERLATRLAHDKTWDSCVTQLKQNIEPLLAKDPDFFPDYTIHGIDHINRVLDIADHLIDFDTLSEEPKKTDLLTPRDVAFLVCGILLHDMGMFLRPDGVRKLVQMDRTDDAFGGKPWKDEWSGYVDRMKRLSQEKMRYHFGKVIPVTEDCVNHTDTDDNKRIIGEFLRQHHARLAHEFAVDVLPGSEGTDLFENTGLKEKDRKLIGLLARSHGMAIRDTEARVKKQIGEGAKPYKTPVFYLMTVLRTADALDADERRAPEKLEKQQKIDVPISVEEWTWNQCIDPDACDWRMEQKNRYIEADPKSSPQYIQLDKWLKGVQADLDLCWSILAEKYPYDCYRLSIHRVVSNIYEPGIRETMNETFLTREVKITANPEIVKLMIEPLYGDDPTYGVRELLQNAVDACVERKKWEEDHGNLNYKGLVDIRIENDIFTITDNGMGMNEDVLLNYYLSAGASYRSSDAWKAANAPDGKSQVARTGKFGVGFLASFLLGDEIEVHTQHRDDRKGYHFKFDQRSMPLDVERKVRSNPYATAEGDQTGTTITIKLKESAVKGLNSNSDQPWYNWYAFDDPHVEYHINGGQRHHVRISLHRNPADNYEWLSLPTDNFATYQWFPYTQTDHPELYSNGMRIYGRFPVNLLRHGLNVYPPHISVTDNEAKLDTDLARKEIKSIPDETILLRELFRFHIARLLLTDWDTEAKCRENLILGFALRPSNSYGRVPFLLSEKGFTLNYVSFFPALSVDNYAILFYDGADTKEMVWNMQNAMKRSIPYSMAISAKTDMAFDLEKSYHFDSSVGFVDSFLSDPSGLFNSSAIHYQVSDRISTAWIHDKVWRSIPYNRKLRLNLASSDYHGQIRFFNYKNRLPDSTKYQYEFPIDKFPVVIHMEVDVAKKDYRDYENPQSLFIRTLKDTLCPAEGYERDDVWIPFGMEERKKKFPRAFETLSVYIDYLRAKNLRDAQREARIIEQRAKRRAEEERKTAQRKAEDEANRVIMKKIIEQHELEHMAFFKKMFEETNADGKHS